MEYMAGLRLEVDAQETSLTADVVTRKVLSLEIHHAQKDDDGMDYMAFCE
jgi:hypothetical protein